MSTVDLLASSCPNKNCPTVYADGDDYIVQGPAVALPDLPGHESAVRVPMSLVDDLVANRLAVRQV